MFDSELAAAVGFTEDELLLNRDGKFSHRQKSKIDAQRRTIKVILLLVSVPMIGVAIVMVLLGGIGIGASDSSATVGAGLQMGGGGLIAGGLFMMLICGPLCYLGLRRGRASEVATLHGPIKLARVERSQRHDQTVHYYMASELHIGGQFLTIPDSSFGFFDEGSEYFAYIEAGADHLLSVEPAV